MTSLENLPVFTPEEEKSIRSILSKTWDYIGPDELALNGGRPFSKLSVINAVLDADYIEIANPSDGPLVSRFRKLPVNLQKKMAEPAFPYSRYL